MMEKTGFDGALRLLPTSLRESIVALLSRDRETAEELRLRLGRPPAVLLPDCEITVGRRPVTQTDLAGVLDLATGASVHAVEQSVRAGYVTAPGGYRLGICGSAVMRDGRLVGFRELSGLAIRIPRQIPGLAEPLRDALFEDGRFRSTLIVSPPGCGKTTLLRDLVRMLSSGRSGLRVSLCDERGELAGLWRGVCQLDVGERTDVLDGCPKAQAAMVLLRSMNPQVLAMDEITAPEDVRAIVQAAGCGVELLATAHAATVEELPARPLYRKVLDTEAFRRAVVIRREGGVRLYRVYKREGHRWSEQ